jgi:hypothetical protein
MDFAFVPGIGDPDLEGLQQFLSKLPHTLVTLTPQPTTLSLYLATLNNVILATNVGPAGNLLIGTHGDEEGQLYLALDPNTQSPATYEKLKSSTTIAIPPAVKDSHTWVRLQTCLLGRDDCHQLLVVLKTALGNPTMVTAPRHIHAEALNLYSGSWEFMMYQFQVQGADLGRTALTSRAAVLAQLADVSNGFELVGSQNVPPAMWDNWVPKAGQLNLAPAKSAQVIVPVYVEAPNFLYNAVPISVPLEIRWVARLQPLPLEPLDCDYIPADADTRQTTLFDLLNDKTKHPEYQDTYLYPIYKRHNYKSLEDFTKGWNWQVKDHPGTTKKYSLQYVGTRYQYRLEIPITKPGTNDLIYNYYPDSGDAPIINFSETNDPFSFYGAA